MPAHTPCTPSIISEFSVGALRHPTLADAASIHELVAADGVLDGNSRYCYLLVCRDFADTSLVVCDREGVAGFVIGYRPPQRRSTLFVWQVGVAKRARRQGLGRLLLRSLLAAPASAGVEFLEATITPSNNASRRLFASVAESIGAACREGPGFPAELFGGGDQQGPRHEEERCFLIGPLASGWLADDGFSRGGRSNGDF